MIFTLSRSRISVTLALATCVVACCGLPLPSISPGLSQDGGEGHFAEPVADVDLFASERPESEKLIEGDLLPSEYLLRIVKQAAEDTELNPPHYPAGENRAVLPKRSRRAILHPQKERSHLWAKGIVPYTFYGSIKEDAQSRGAIRRAIRHWEEKTCIRFVELSKNNRAEDYIVFVDAGDGPCSSHYGRILGPQRVNIGRKCNQQWGMVVHELGHVIGFLHEQSRPDRDQYVRVLWENMPNDKDIRENFRKYLPSDIDSLGVEYDYDSVMHYDRKAFSINGKDTIVALNNTSRTLGQRKALSPKDIEQANRLYQCPPPTQTPCLTRNNPVQVGAQVSLMYKPRKYLFCQNTECRRSSCRALSKSNCNTSTIPTSCHGHMFRIQARGRIQGDLLHVGDEVMLQTENWKGDSIWPSYSSATSYIHSDCPTNSMTPWTSCRENVFNIFTHNKTAQKSRSPVRENDRIAFCQTQTTVLGKRLQCLSCGNTSGPACHPVICQTGLHNCQKVAFTVRQWLQNL